MGKDDVRKGLRLLETEVGLAANVRAESAELVDYESTRTAGRAARLAMLVRGQDVIEDEKRLKKIAAIELKITPGEYDRVKRFLLDTDLLKEQTLATGKQVLYEKVQRLDYAQNYERIAQRWEVDKDRSTKEVALVQTLDRIVETPQLLTSIDSLSALSPDEAKAVLEVGSNAAIFDTIKSKSGQTLYSPLLFDAAPSDLSKFLQVADQSQFKNVLDSVRGRPGVDVTGNSDPIFLAAIRAGVLPTYKVNSTNGERQYSFAPYAGSLLNSALEKTILDKARALVACLRYGMDAAAVTRIKYPTVMLRKLLDKSTSHRIGPHSEIKNQYGMLVTKQLGRIVPTQNSRYFFELIPSEDNLRACSIALEFFTTGEVVEAKAGAEPGQMNLFETTVNHPLNQVLMVKTLRPATSDELASLVEGLQNVHG